MELTEARQVAGRLSELHRQCGATPVYVLGTGAYAVLCNLWGETLVIASADMAVFAEARIAAERRRDEEHTANTGHD